MKICQCPDKVSKLPVITDKIYCTCYIHILTFQMTTQTIQIATHTNQLPETNATF